MLPAPGVRPPAKDRPMTLSNDARFWTAARAIRGFRCLGSAGYERTLRTGELLAKSDHVLELGCGTGSTALRLAADVASYLGTDFSPAMIAIAQESWPPPRLPPCPSSPRRLRIRHCGPANTTRCWRSTICTWCATCRHAAAHPRPAGRRRPVHLQDAVPGRHESVDPAGLAAGHARHRQGAYAGAFSASALERQLAAAGFEILATEIHADGGSDRRPYIVARKG